MQEPNCHIPVYFWLIIFALLSCKKDNTEPQPTLRPGDIIYAKPSVPEILAPTDGSIGISPSPTLTWNYHFPNLWSDARQSLPIIYTVWLDTSLNPITSVAVDTITSWGPNSNIDNLGNIIVSLSIDITDLNLLTKYYWKINVKDAKGATQTSSIWSFTTRGEIVVPQVTTNDVITITGTTAIVGGNVISDGWSQITDRGIYIGQSSDPEASGTKLQIGDGSGSFSVSLKGLKPNTTYYVKAYATNNKGTSFGTNVVFTTKPDYDLPILLTTIKNWTTNSAIVGGTISYDGGDSVTVCGICWSTSENPTITSNITIDSTGTGEFIAYLTSLEIQTTYFIRAYATNSIGTGYGNQLSFSTKGYLNDSDGNIYLTQPIGNQIWMAENLKTTKFNDGVSIPNVTDQVLWYKLSSPGYCWYNNDEITNKNIYGALYNWYAVNTGKLCPIGWHVPSDDEWQTLLSFLGGANVAGAKLKNNTGWRSNDNNANNESGFSALPGGQTYFNNLGISGSWWSASIMTSSLSNSVVFANSLLLLDSYPVASSWSYTLQTGINVRCLKNKN